MDKETIMEIAGLCLEGLMTDGAHYKQWYLEEILKLTNVHFGVEELKDRLWDKGIPP